MEWKPLSRAKKYLCIAIGQWVHISKKEDLGKAWTWQLSRTICNVRSVTKWTFFECLLFCARFGLWCRGAWRVSSTKPPWSWQACVPAEWYQAAFDCTIKRKKKWQIIHMATYWLILIHRLTLILFVCCILKSMYTALAIIKA